MKEVNPLKLTIVVIPLAIILTFLVRYIIGVTLGTSIHPAFTLVIYIITFAVLKILGERFLRKRIVSRGKSSWIKSE